MFNYDRNVALMAYRAEHPQKRRPSEADLESYDQALFARLDAEITNQMAAKGIADTPFNRSMIAFFASRSKAQAAKTRVKFGVRYFESVIPVDPCP